MSKTGSMRMRRVMLNHAQAERHGKAGAAWLALGVLTAACVLYTIFHLQAQMNALQADRYSLQHPAAIKAVKLPASELASKQDEIKTVQAAMAELGLSWEPLFGMLESVAIPQVRVMAIEPNARQKKLRLTAEAVSFSDMLAYANLLGSKPILKDSFLLNHQQTADGRAMPFSFVIEAVWLN